MSLDEERLYVPAGFRNVLESLTIAVLRERPENIHQFAANFFKERLIARQKNGYDECLLGSQIDGFYRYEPNGRRRTCNDQPRYETRKEHLVPEKRTNSDDDDTREQPKSASENNSEGKQTESEKEKNEAAIKIQACYHGYACRKEIAHQSEAAVCIQSNYRGYKARKEIGHEKITDQSQGEITDTGELVTSEAGLVVSTALRSSDNATSDSGLTHGDDKAATCIQAGYRGYRAREDLKTNYKSAATIQAGYRGHLVRKEFKEKDKAATTIQAGYRGHCVRKVQRARSDAAKTIQAGYREYAAKRGQKQLRGEGNRSSSTGNLLPQKQEEKNLQDGEFGSSEYILPPQERKEDELESGVEGKAAHLTVQQGLLQNNSNNSRYSFSLPPEDVKFDADLDSDSDTDIDKIVHKIAAKTIHEAEEEGVAQTEGGGRSENAGVNQV